MTGFTEQLARLITANCGGANPDLASVINVDHHLQDPGYGHRSLLDRTAASTGLIVHELSKAWNVPLDVETATALLATLYYDTGSLQHANTDARALRMAADCVRAGADAGLVAAKLYRSKTTKALRLWGRALERTELHPTSGMALSVITQQDFRDLDVTPEEANGIVSFLSHVPECRFALLLTEEEPGSVKGSLRSNEHKDTDVASIARVLGGGGHRLASGFRVPGRIERRDGRYVVV
ncbi:MAG: DHHA1 domain-containing protein [Candidatus Andersenbacteria bacterium]